MELSYNVQVSMELSYNVQTSMELSYNVQYAVTHAHWDLKMCPYWSGIYC